MDEFQDLVGREQGVRLRAVKVAAARLEGGEMATYWWYILGRRLSLDESESGHKFASEKEPSTLHQDNQQQPFGRRREQNEQLLMIHIGEEILSKGFSWDESESGHSFALEREPTAQ